MPNSDLQRTSLHIQSAIKSFCKTRIQTNPLFFLSDLHRYVAGCPGITVAPASPDRILRNMRQKGIVDYVVVNRSKSFYKVTKVA